MNIIQITRVLLLGSILALLSACGGGSPATTTTTTTATNGWQRGVFQNESTFYAKCAAPRTGTNPVTGQAYPDTRGTMLDENNFLRSYSNNTYLWYNEITDQNPASFTSPLAYFDVLRTSATTLSGAPKDKFHFTYNSLEWYQLSQGGVSAGYGLEWAVISATPPRRIVVAYTEPNTPATVQNITRGATVLAIDGVDINTTTQTGINTLNNGLHPSTVNTTHTFTIQDIGAVNSRPVTMTSTQITNAMVQNTQVIVTPTGRVGYMTFNYHRAPAEQALINAVNTLNAGQGINDLVLDLRYNGGGYLAIASQLAYMIAGSASTAGKAFETIQFNNKHPITDPVTRSPLTPTPFHSQTLGFSVTVGQALPTLNLSRVFVLTGAGTCSASESIINGLRGAGIEVIQIGSTTCGKPYGFYPADNCGTTYFTIQFRGVNALGFGDYADGFSPAAVGNNQANITGCTVADDYTRQLGDPAENRLEVALAYQAGRGCISPVATTTPGLLAKPDYDDALDGVVQRSLFDSNRILNR